LSVQNNLAFDLLFLNFNTEAGGSVPCDLADYTCVVAFHFVIIVQLIAFIKRQLTRECRILFRENNVQEKDVLFLVKSLNTINRPITRKLPYILKRSGFHETF